MLHCRFSFVQDQRERKHTKQEEEEGESRRRTNLITMLYRLSPLPFPLSSGDLVRKLSSRSPPPFSYSSSSTPFPVRKELEMKMGKKMEKSFGEDWILFCHRICSNLARESSSKFAQKCSSFRLTAFRQKYLPVVAQMTEIFSFALCATKAKKYVSVFLSFPIHGNNEVSLLLYDKGAREEGGV